MRTFIGVVIALALGVVLLVALGWIYFYDDGNQMGIGVNRNEVVEESNEIADSVTESVRNAGAELEELGGRDRPDSVPAVDGDR